MHTIKYSAFLKTCLVKYHHRNQSQTSSCGWY